jgi:predicted DNA-binding transcriptional regulator AlpA
VNNLPDWWDEMNNESAEDRRVRQAIFERGWIEKDLTRIPDRLAWIGAARTAVLAEVGVRLRHAQRLEQENPGVAEVKLEMTRAAELTGLSRPTLYKWRDQQSDPAESDVQPDSVMVAGRPVERLRQSHAQAVNYGYGAGAVEGQRLVDDWWDDRSGYDRAVEIIADTTLASWYAQQSGPNVDDYLNGMEASDQARGRITPDRRAVLDVLYRAGWDMGFIAELVKGCVRIRDRGPSY